MTWKSFPLLVVGTVVLHAAEPQATPWSFSPVQTRDVPAVRQTEWCKGEVDRFLLARMEAVGLTPGADTDRLTLLRRVTFDLTGLPPTPEEQAAFADDAEPDDAALTKVVDRLLASPHYGERWGRHWLDVVHYADSVGRARNAALPAARRYRDWVIDSLNADKNFALFAAEQIAGDLLPASSVEQQRERVIGTGLLALSPLSLPERESIQFELDRLDDQIDVTTRAFLGLTVSCARCHDHKTDPITQRDYYALAGIFFSSKTFFDRNLRLLSADNLADRAMGLGEGRLRDCAIRVKGDPRRTEGPPPPRGDLRLPGLPPLRAVSKRESGRLQLAEWIVSPQNPLTARVIVNRVWARIFGRGLVTTVDDFGMTGEQPSHPELLDALALQFTGEFDWSLKKLIRSLVLSHAYRVSSAGDPERQAKDPWNERFWRMNPKRLEVEAVRDQMLAAAGLLRPERPAGPQVAGDGGRDRSSQTRPLLTEWSPYRTVYLPVLRDMLPDLYKTFDFPAPTQVKGQREVTTVPGQALFFLNSELARATAKACATRILENPALAGEEERIQQAFALLLGRLPEPLEMQDARVFLSDGEPVARWRSLVQALMATAEFITVW